MRRAQRREVLAGIGGFGALVELPAGYQRPVLVAGTDGVGTKLRLAIDTGRHDTIGIDLVAMCANDVVVQGAEPLFFLDYYATGKLQVGVAEAVVRGIVEGCVQAGAALVGGETAEMPGMYHGEDYDLAGFCVGVVEKDAIIDGAQVAAGRCDHRPRLLGPALQRLFADPQAHRHGGRHAGDACSTAAASLTGCSRPTRIYVKPLLALHARAAGAWARAHHRRRPHRQHPARAARGSGSGARAARWQRDPLFDWLQHTGRIDAAEMYRTFNCGIGMVAIVPAERAAAAVQLLSARGETAQLIGEVRPGEPRRGHRRMSAGAAAAARRS